MFGYPAETAMRAAMLVGFGVDAAALGILLGRRNDLAPRDYQRVRWVIWGCLVGLPAFLIAELSQVTSLPSSLLGTVAILEDVFGLLYLVNGILCLFVVEAVRRPTVVSVSIPLRRARAVPTSGLGGTVPRAGWNPPPPGSIGWTASDADTLHGGDTLLAGRFGGVPFPLDAIEAADTRFPAGLARPLLGVPVGNPRRCFAVVLYGSHESGTDLTGNERNLLAGLARHAGVAYEHVQSEMLHQRIAALEGELARAAAVA